jgi:hypothetical protein
MSSNQKIMMYVGIGLLVTLAVIGLWMLLQCKGIKHGGKCYNIIAQDDPTSSLANVAKIKDGKMDTSADKPATTAATVTLKVNGATDAAKKKVKGARVTAKADLVANSTTKSKVKLANGLTTKEFEFAQDGKSSSVVVLFDAEQEIGAGGLTLTIDPNVTVYEVELI